WCQGTCYVKTTVMIDRIHLTSQVVCDDNLVFTDVVAGGPGSVHDSRVLRISELWNTSANMFPGDTHLLGDGGYPLLRLAVHFIIATCVLHNFCILHDDFYDGYLMDDDSDDHYDDGDHCPGGTAEQKRTHLMNSELHPSLSSESLLSEFNPSSGVEDRVEDEEELPQEVSNVKTGFTVGLSPMQSSISLKNFQFLKFPTALISSNINIG
ncbi:unnamed protein product, partial [Porites lobata]